MQKEQMNVHKGLAELKLLQYRIDKAIETGVFCKQNKRSNTKIDGMDLQEYSNKVIKADFDSVTDLINRRQNIKSAIIKSNAETMVEISGVKMSVAEAIDKKSSIQNDNYLLYNLKTQYSKALKNIELNNDSLTSKADEQINLLYSNKDNIDPVKIQSLKNDYINENTLDLIDPLGIKSKIDKLEKEIEGFNAEVDFVLSTSNALTIIEI